MTYHNEVKMKNKEGKLFFDTVLRVTPLWGNKPEIEVFSQNKVKKLSINKISLKCDSISGSISNSISELRADTT